MKNKSKPVTPLVSGNYQKRPGACGPAPQEKRRLSSRTRRKETAKAAARTAPKISGRKLPPADPKTIQDLVALLAPGFIIHHDCDREYGWYFDLIDMSWQIGAIGILVADHEIHNARNYLLAMENAGRLRKTGLYEWRLA